MRDLAISANKVEHKRFKVLLLMCRLESNSSKYAMKAQLKGPMYIQGTARGVKAMTLLGGVYPRDR